MLKKLQVKTGKTRLSPLKLIKIGQRPCSPLRTGENRGGKRPEPANLRDFRDFRRGSDRRRIAGAGAPRETQGNLFKNSHFLQISLEIARKHGSRSENPVPVPPNADFLRPESPETPGKSLQQGARVVPVQKPGPSEAFPHVRRRFDHGEAKTLKKLPNFLIKIRSWTSPKRFPTRSSRNPYFPRMIACIFPRFSRASAPDALLPWSSLRTP